jgi:hypothetical protein
MNPQVQAATQAIQGLSPSQSAPAPAVNITTPAGFNAQGGMNPVSTADPGPSQFSDSLNKMYATQAQAAMANLGIQSAVGKNATDINNLYNQYQQKHSQDILNATLQQQQQNPANFKRVPSQDGGYNFTDGAGNKITAWQYAAATGQDMSSVLKGSQNPNDQQYIKDESILNNLSNAWYSQDPLAQDKAAQQAGFKNASDLHSTLQKQGINTPQDLWKAFMNSYPNVWGQGTGTSVGGGRNFPAYGTQQQTPSTFLGQPPASPSIGQDIGNFAGDVYNRIKGLF